MARSSKKSKSLTTLAKSLDTRKLPLPARGEGRGEGLSTAQRALLARAVRKPAEAKPNITTTLANKPPVPQTKPASVRAPVPVPVQRSVALSSLQRSPSPLPSRVPVAARPSMDLGPDARRQYPRAPVTVKARLALADDPRRVFEASLDTINLSVGGLFLQSSFFLKMGTQLLVTLQLPDRGREVKVKAEVVRVVSGSEALSGLALRFTEYLDGSQVTLATHFLSPVLREFLGQYAKEHHFAASAEYLAHTADVLAAWELKKAELGGDVWDLFAKQP